MGPLVYEIGAVVLCYGLWYALFGLVLLRTRIRWVQPGPSTQELGPEPPAIASLVAGGWELTEDAAEATLLDLGERKVLEFRQPGDNPFRTTIHIVQSSPAGLNRYEQMVFDRVSGLAVDGVVPLPALTFRHETTARTWARQFRAEVIAAARSAGLSRRRLSPSVATAGGGQRGGQARPPMPAAADEAGAGVLAGGRDGCPPRLLQARPDASAGIPSAA